METYDKKAFLESVKILSQASKILNRTLHKGELINTILEETVRLSNADLVALVLLEDGGLPKELFVSYAQTKRRMPLGPGEIDFEIQKCPFGQPLELPESDPWRQYFQGALGVTLQTKLRVQLIYGDRLTGYLDFYGSTADQFINEDLIEFLKALGDHFAIALENAELYEQAQRQSLENSLLMETGQMLANVLDLDEVMQAIIMALKRVIHYDAVGIYLLKDTGVLEPIVWNGYGDEPSCPLAPTKLGEGLVGWVGRSGQGVVVDDVTQDERYISGRAATQSELVVPIKLKEKVIGVFNIEADQPKTYSEHDLEILAVFAAQSAIAIERASLYRDLLSKRRLDQEVQIARTIQKSFLPRADLRLEGYDISGVNISSSVVGGDYYDYISISENQYGLVIADVSGKGIPAALIMASLRASLIAEIRNNYAIRAIMQKVNRLMSESLDRGNFVTAVYGVLDSKNRIFTFCNAGHNPPLWFRRSSEVLELKEGGLGLGINPDSLYEERPLGLSSGDLLVFFTDGVTEAANEGGEQFETGRIIEIVSRNRSKSAGDIVAAIAEAVRAFKASDFVLDDLTLMVLKVR